jgi:predicted lipoprotein with Yx(FWY)xxD motif
VKRILGLGTIAVVLLAGCGGGESSTPGPNASFHVRGPGSTPVLTVNTAEVAGVGTVLVDARGFTLYHLKTESASDIQCTANCTDTWPPLLLATPGGPTGGVHVTGELAAVSRPDGGKQVTYDDMPLYTYAGDTKPGQARGQGVGGVWFAVTSGGDEGGSTPSPTETEYGY